MTIPDAAGTASRRRRRRVRRGRRHLPLRPPRDDRRDAVAGRSDARVSPPPQGAAPRSRAGPAARDAAARAPVPPGGLAVCVAGVAAHVADDLLRRDRVHPDLPLASPRPGTRRGCGEPYGFQTLYTFLVAPAWWIDDTKTAWEAAKLIGALVMSTTLFPAYGLARLVVSRPWALFAAAGAVAVPPLAYRAVSDGRAAGLSGRDARRSADRARDRAADPMVVRARRGHLPDRAVRPGRAQRPVAGPRAVRLHARLASDRASREWRSRLERLGLGGRGHAGRRSGRDRSARRSATARRRGTWRPGSSSNGCSSTASGRSARSRSVSASSRSSRGSLGLCVAAFRPERNLRAFGVTGWAAVLCFGMYAAVKGGVPLDGLRPARARAQRDLPRPAAPRRDRIRARASRSCTRLPWWCRPRLAVYLVLTTPYELDQYPVLRGARALDPRAREPRWIWDQPKIERGLIVVLALSVALLIARIIVQRRAVGAGARSCRGRRSSSSWGLTTEIYAARGLNTLRRTPVRKRRRRPSTGSTASTGGEQTLYLGQSIIDKNPIWLLEFWNRSVRPCLEPRRQRAAPVAVARSRGGRWDAVPRPRRRIGSWHGNGVEVVGRVAAEPRGGMTLFRTEPPLRLRFAQTGVYPDGWMGARGGLLPVRARRGRLAASHGSSCPGTGWCGKDIPGKITVKVGPIAVRNKQPGLGRVAQIRRGVLHSCELKTFVIPAVVPFRVEVSISPTFSPFEDQSRPGRRRANSAHSVGFGFIPLG